MMEDLIKEYAKKVEDIIRPLSYRHTLSMKALEVELREGGKAFLSLFDLEKAFDTIEKAVLLQCLYNKGICGIA